MGYTTRNNGAIADFWPDDTEDTIYTYNGITMGDMFVMAANKWGHITMDDISISAEHIHTTCLYYDSYDPMDYTDFVVIKRIK